jgi:hypothetical protein
VWPQQRLYRSALGYEDLDDYDASRREPLWQTADGPDEPLSSSPPLCRWGNRARRQEAWLTNQVLFEPFVASFEAPPEQLILDPDAIDDQTMRTARKWAPIYGCYGDYCFLLLHLSCSEQLYYFEVLGVVTSEP